MEVSIYGNKKRCADASKKKHFKTDSRKLCDHVVKKANTAYVKEKLNG